MKPPPKGGAVTDAILMIDEWLGWYGSLPWWRKVLG
jgi:hypothetical protein